MIGQRAARRGDGGVDDVRGRDPLAFGIDRRRVDARHVEDVLEEACQPIELLKRQLRLARRSLRRKRQAPAGW